MLFVFSTFMWHHFLFYIQDLLINTTGGASSSPAPRLHPPKSTEESLPLASESVGENQKEEPEIVVAPLVLLKNQEQKNQPQKPML
jgi:hypothetical protein